MAQLGWPPASYLPISASPVLRLQAWVTAPGFRGSDLGPLASWTELTPQLLVPRKTVDGRDLQKAPTWSGSSHPTCSLPVSVGGMLREALDLVHAKHSATKSHPRTPILVP